MQEWRERAYREAAERENTQRRAERELNMARKYGAERLAQAVIPAFDNLTRALQAVEEGGKDERDTDFKNLHAALVMTAKEMDKALEQNAIQRLNPLGERFNPEHHQAMMQVESTVFPQGHVAQVLAEGFLLHDRPLKAAYVAVSTGPGPAGGEQGGTEQNDSDETN